MKSQYPVVSPRILRLQPPSRIENGQLIAFDVSETPTVAVLLSCDLVRAHVLGAGGLSDEDCRRVFVPSSNLDYLREIAEARLSEAIAGSDPEPLVRITIAAEDFIPLARHISIARLSIPTGWVGRLDGKA